MPDLGGGGVQGFPLALRSYMSSASVLSELNAFWGRGLPKVGVAPKIFRARVARIPVLNPPSVNPGSATVLYIIFAINNNKCVILLLL